MDNLPEAAVTELLVLSVHEVLHFGSRLFVVPKMLSMQWSLRVGEEKEVTW